ncbi:hypothetical protein E2C01_015388 [Portunus trituberculatus]|uniref:Uncharacterized protein n=1 Tax=Portunus trituberculatus TaxID=210409 RepID=A0A5B7DMW3_PORTR|nr:hypothetical protein [Portunus trituberculatus]
MVGGGRSERAARPTGGVGQVLDGAGTGPDRVGDWWRGCLIEQERAGDWWEGAGSGAGERPEWFRCLGYWVWCCVVCYGVRCGDDGGAVWYGDYYQLN